MNNQVLITYATCTGFTKGVAEAICQTLIERGIPTQIVPMKEVKELSSYKAVIAGSGVQGRKWLPEAVQFVKEKQEVLSTKPFAMFMVCITLAMSNGEKYRAGLREWMEPVRRLVKPVSEGYFAGGLNIAKIPGLGNRIKFRLSVMMGVWKEGDHRDWNAIKAWASQLEPLI